MAMMRRGVLMAASIRVVRLTVTAAWMLIGTLTPKACWYSVTGIGRVMVPPWNSVYQKYSREAPRQMRRGPSAFVFRSVTVTRTKADTTRPRVGIIGSSS